MTRERQGVPPKLEIPKYNHASRFSKAWEPYIAANIYIYAVPLAIFLRRSRELDFSANKFDKSVQLVKSVFRVFSPDVVDAVSRHLSGSDRFGNLIDQHADNLGTFAPPQRTMTLASCQPDVRGLLEEVYMHHQKKIGELGYIDLLAGKIESVFGRGVVAVEEKIVESLAERAKLIVQLPIDYIFLPVTSDAAKGANSSRDTAFARDASGHLTAAGRERLLRGEIRCVPASVEYVGDKMRSAVQVHEISILVKFFTGASDAINLKLGITDEKATPLNRIGFRFNLRFLADYRSLGFTLVVAYLFAKICFK
jgi:hypothetical protein